LPPARAALEKTAHLNNETDALRTELKLLLGRAEKYVNDWHQPGWKMTVTFAREKQQLIDDFKLWQGHYVTWYWAEAKKFGIEHPTPTPAG